MPTTFRARSRHAFARGARAFTLVETLIFMTVIALVASAFTVSAIAATKSQRAHKNVDIASQASAGILERAQSTPWNQLGFHTSDPYYVATYAGKPTVDLPAAPTGERVMPREVVTVKNVRVTIRTYIVWLRQPTAAAAAAGNSYGTKQVTTVASWSEGGTPRSARYQINRTATPNEAVAEDAANPITTDPADDIQDVNPPVTAPDGTADGADEDGQDGYDYGNWVGDTGVDQGDPLPCAPITVTGGYARATVTWTPVTGASYRLYVDGVLRASPTVGSGSYYFLGLEPGKHTFRLDSIADGRSTTGCTARNAEVAVPPAMTCPTVTITTEPGVANLSWTGVEAAAEYLVYRNNTLVRTVPEGTTTTRFTGLAYGSYTFRVDARLMGDTSAGCGTQTVTVPATPPDCPSWFVTPEVSNQLLTWNILQVNNASAYRIILDGAVETTLAQTGAGKVLLHTKGAVAPGTYTTRVDVAALDGTWKQCDTKSVTLEANAPKCPTFTATVNSSGDVVVTIPAAATRVDEYLIRIASTDVERVTPTSFPFTRTYPASAFDYQYGTDRGVAVRGYQASTGLWTTGCDTARVDVPWPTTAACPTTSQFTATASGRTIVGQLQRVTSVEQFTITVKNAQGAVVWTGTVPGTGGSFTTGRLTYAGTYTVTSAVKNPNAPARTCSSRTVVIPPLELSDTFSGSGTMGSTEVGSEPWLFPGGATFTRQSGDAYTTSAMTQNPFQAVETGLSNVDITIPVRTGGEAIYFRVVDGDDWLRARARRTSTTVTNTYYRTEYLWTTYRTEYEFADRRTRYNYSGTETYWETRTPVTEYEYKISNVSYGNWSDWSPTGEQTLCRLTRPDDTYTDTRETQWTWMINQDCGDPDKKRYREQERTRSKTVMVSYTWSRSTTPPTNGTATGNTRTDYDNTGNFYWARTRTNSYDRNAGQTREIKYSCWDTSCMVPGDTLVGTVADQVYDYYWQASQTPRDSNDTATGNTRQVVAGTYWSQDYCAGCQTRQVGPFYDTVTTYYYSVVVSKSVNGTLTDLATYTVPSHPNSLRVTLSGPSIRVRYADTNDLGTVTDSTHAAATKHGTGLAGPSEVTPDGIDNFRLIEVP